MFRENRKKLLTRFYECPIFRKKGKENITMKKEETETNEKFVYTDDDNIEFVPGDPDDDLSDVVDLLKNGFKRD